MLRSLLRCTFLILIFAELLFGQGVTGGQKSALPAPSSASPSVVTQAGSTSSNVSVFTGVVPDPLAEATRHYRHGEFDAAIQSYNAVLQKNPMSPDAYAGLDSSLSEAEGSGAGL